MDAAPDTWPGTALDTGSDTAQSGVASLGRRRASRARLRREEVYADLRRRILAGDFPTRTRLAEEPLAALLEVSRTPVREALVRLHADRLLRRSSDGGYEVAEPDVTQLRDLYELRIALETRGLQRVLETGVPHDPAVMADLLTTWEGLQESPPAPDSQFVDFDEDFHVRLSIAAGNPLLTETLETVNARIRPVRMYDFLTADRIELTIVQHLAIIRAVIAGDIDEAVEQLRRNVGESMAVVERRAVHAITQMALHRGARP
ncbi:MAG: GntR family transcriptional regulator [Actinomycetota bacterium]|nr:MAG: GntR family transcriptional regulator [Actinomycetota bacterium]